MGGCGVGGGVDGGVDGGVGGDTGECIKSWNSFVVSP